MAISSFSSTPNSSRCPIPRENHLAGQGKWQDWCWGVVTTDQSKHHYASAWRKPGRLLVQISNLSWQDGEVSASFNLAKLGLNGNAQDAVTGETIAIKDGSITLPIPAYDSRLVLVE